VYVHEELALDVLGRETTEAGSMVSRCLLSLAVVHLLDFIENDTAGLSYPKQPHDCRDNNQQAQQPPIGAWKIENVIVLYAF
jgi:hypothetical protein